MRVSEEGREEEGAEVEEAEEEEVEEEGFEEAGCTASVDLRAAVEGAAEAEAECW